MAVFRVEKNRGYTVMSNHHLRNPDLSLKAKGLLSQMLSLPENWDYTLKGLSSINKESIDAIRTAVWELEKAGYITRRQGRDDKGKMTAIEYTIYEQPQPQLENPTTDNPVSENPTQLNKELSSKELSNTDLLNTHSIPILSTPLPEGTATPERKGNGYTNMDAVRAYEEVIKDNIEYAFLIQDKKEAAIDALRKRETKDNEIAAQKGLKPYTLLNVELNDGTDEKSSGHMGWYYVTLAVGGEIHSHIETGLNYAIADGKVSETPTRENYFVAGALKESDVDYVFNNVGFSSTSDLYSLPVREDVRERAEKTLAERTEAQQKAPETKTIYYTMPYLWSC